MNDWTLGSVLNSVFLIEPIGMRVGFGEMDKRPYHVPCNLSTQQDLRSQKPWIDPSKVRGSPFAPVMVDIITLTECLASNHFSVIKTLHHITVGKAKWGNRF